jgi:hypothetical protein
MSSLLKVTTASNTSTACRSLVDQLKVKKVLARLYPLRLYLSRRLLDTEAGNVTIL